MAEEKEARLPQSGASRMSRGQQRRRQRSVFQYIAILFAAAFVLLLFTFMMERRQYQQLQEENRENLNDLQQSVSAYQSLQGMLAENEQLRRETAGLEDRLEELEGQLASAQQDRTALQQQLQDWEQTIQAMDWFWQIDEAYVRGRYALCRELIQSLEEAQLARYLPTESITDNGRFSPADRYQEICDRVVR